MFWEHIGTARVSADKMWVLLQVNIIVECGRGDAAVAKRHTAVLDHDSVLRVDPVNA